MSNKSRLIVKISARPQGTFYIGQDNQPANSSATAARFETMKQARKALLDYAIEKDLGFNFTWEIIPSGDKRHVLLSLKPYYVFLIIAESLGIRGVNRKTIEVRKDIPVAEDWSKKVFVYCTKDTKSFKRIPKKYRQYMLPYLGTVVGYFNFGGYTKYEWEWHPTGKARVSDELSHNVPQEDLLSMALSRGELTDYATNEPIYGWRIEDVQLFNRPLALRNLITYGDRCQEADCGQCNLANFAVYGYMDVCTVPKGFRPILTPPQSWMYFNEVM